MLLQTIQKQWHSRWINFRLQQVINFPSVCDCKWCLWILGIDMNCSQSVFCLSHSIPSSIWIHQLQVQFERFCGLIGKLKFLNYNTYISQMWSVMTSTAPTFDGRSEPKLVTPVFSSPTEHPILVSTLSMKPLKHDKTMSTQNPSVFGHKTFCLLINSTSTSIMAKVCASVSWRLSDVAPRAVSAPKTI